MTIRLAPVELLIALLLTFTGMETIMAMEINSAAFADGGTIPTQYTCQGNNLSPPLSWAGIPEQAKSLVLIIDDPDAPDPQAPKMTWVHWVLYNLPPENSGLPEAAKKLPQGRNKGLTVGIKPATEAPVHRSDVTATFINSTPWIPC